jgi:hypothetical protein
MRAVVNFEIRRAWREKEVVESSGKVVSEQSTGRLAQCRGCEQAVKVREKQRTSRLEAVKKVKK